MIWHVKYHVVLSSSYCFMSCGVACCAVAPGNGKGKGKGEGKGKGKHTKGDKDLNT